MKIILLFAALTAQAIPSAGGDLLIHLNSVSPISRRVMRYQCDATAPKLGLPKGPFPVEYINGGGNSLAILPVSGQTRIFVNVMSGSGARYVSQQYTWWEARGRSITFRRSDLQETTESACQELPR